MSAPTSLSSPIALDGGPIALHAFVVGFEPIPESMSIRGGSPTKYLLEPVTASAVQYKNGWILLDGGFNLDVVRSVEGRAEHLNYDSYTAVVPPGDPLRGSVERAGLDWRDLRGVCVSHAHLDHTGIVPSLDPAVPVIIQQREWQWLEAGAGKADVVIAQDLLGAAGQVRLIDGDALIAPGLWAIDTPGHTPGHQSFKVDLPSQVVVLACDAADLRENILTRTPCGWTPQSGGLELAQQSIDRLADLEAAGVNVWPGHDPGFDPWVRAARGERVVVS